MRRAVWVLSLAVFGCDTASTGGADAGADASPDGAPLEVGVPDARPDGAPGDAAVLDMAADAASLDMASLDMAPDMASLDMDPDMASPDMAPDMTPPDAGPPACAPGVTVSLGGADLPPAAAGLYVEAFDCARDEGGAWFGGVDYTRCFRKDDGSSWRIWNTGCGWEVGQPDAGGWQRYARTYSGQCAAMPPQQADVRALTTGVLYDGFGALIEGARLDRCPDPAPCDPGVAVSGVAGDLPPEMGGRYAAAFDCAREEGGAWFGGVDPEVCFRKDDGSAWRIWNTGCGWEIGRVARGDWQRYARTYSGQCAEMPAAQRGPEALTTGVLYDGFGALIEGLRVDHCPADRGCMPGAEFDQPIRDREGDVGGHYAEAFDCTRGEGGAWFGGDYTHCFRKADGTAWRIWNTGCGWEVGRVERGDWQRVARTYTGQCAAMPPWQLDARGLSSHPLFDGFGRTLEGFDLEPCLGPPVCPPEAVVSLEGDGAPADVAGVYAEAFDCARDEGGAWFGGDFTRCFRKVDGSGWLIWNTGCGWEIGRVERDGWARYGRTYSGQCAEMPPAQLDARALTTGVLYDGFGARVEGLRVDHCR